MKESDYQAKLIQDISKLGGVAINGQYTVAGEADLQCGIPINGVLHHLVIEVKTEVDYNRVMSSLTIVEGIYTITNAVKLKPHEPLQVYKLNRNRKMGGLALFAYSIIQVVEYIDGTKRTSTGEG